MICPLMRPLKKVDEMRDIKFQVPTTQGWIDVDGRTAGYELAAHQQLNGHGFRVSHIRTGMGIPGTKRNTMIEAVALATNLEREVDWSTISRGEALGEVVGLTNEFKAAARRAVDELTGFEKDGSTTE